MVDIFDIQKALVKKGITPLLHWKEDKRKFYLDLNTRAKSDLFLWEDLWIDGRYGYRKSYSVGEYDTIESVLESLCWHFLECLHGRPFWSGEWAAELERKDVVK